MNAIFQATERATPIWIYTIGSEFRSTRGHRNSRFRTAFEFLQRNRYVVVSFEYLNPFGMKDFETDKLFCVDVKATDQRGRLFVIEVQIVVQSSFAKRAVFYACEAYTDQLRVGQGYSDLKATYSICLLMRNLWEDDQLHHQFRLVDRESGRVLEDSIEIHTVELAKYNGGPIQDRTVPDRIMAGRIENARCETA